MVCNIYARPTIELFINWVLDFIERYSGCTLHDFAYIIECKIALEPILCNVHSYFQKWSGLPIQDASDSKYCNYRKSLWLAHSAPANVTKYHEFRCIEILTFNSNIEFQLVSVVQEMAYRSLQIFPNKNPTLDFRITILPFHVPPIHWPFYFWGAESNLFEPGSDVWQRIKLNSISRPWEMQFRTLIGATSAVD